MSHLQRLDTRHTCAPPELADPSVSHRFLCDCGAIYLWLPAWTIHRTERRWWRTERVTYQRHGGCWKLDKAAEPQWVDVIVK